MQNISAINPNTTQKAVLIPINTNKLSMQKQAIEEKNDGLEISQKKEQETFIDKLKKNKKPIILTVICAVAAIGTVVYLLKRRGLPVESPSIRRNLGANLDTNDKTVDKINNAPAMSNKKQTTKQKSNIKFERFNLSSKSRKTSSRIASNSKKTIINSKKIFKKSNMYSQEGKRKYDEILTIINKANKEKLEKFNIGKKTITFEKHGDGTIEILEQEAGWLRTSTIIPLKTNGFKIENITEVGSNFSKYYEYENGKISKITRTKYKDKTKIIEEFFAYNTSNTNETLLTRYKRSASNLSNGKRTNSRDEIYLFNNKRLSGYEKNESDSFTPINNYIEQIEFENEKIKNYRKEYENNTY